MGDGRANRREALETIGVAGAALLVGCGAESGSKTGTGGSGGGTSRGGRGGGGTTAGSGAANGSGPCIVRPTQTEGPYFVDTMLDRSDIRSDPASGEVREGVPLRISFRVSRAAGSECAPFESAIVDLWQCDALGVYGGVLDGSGLFDTRGQLFLRGSQATDENGAAEFLTIYPGWYVGRTLHLHFKVRTIWNGSLFDFTSQLYFEESVNDRVMQRPPYDARGPRSTLNAMDGIFASGGDALVLPLVEEGDGWAGALELGLAL